MLLGLLFFWGREYNPARIGLDSNLGGERGAQRLTTMSIRRRLCFWDFDPRSCGKERWMIRPQKTKKGTWREKEQKTTKKKKKKKWKEKQGRSKEEKNDSHVCLTNSWYFTKQCKHVVSTCQSDGCRFSGDHCFGVSYYSACFPL